MISRRDVLIGSAALAAGSAPAADADEIGIPVTLQSDRSPVLEPGPAPAGILSLVGPGNEPVIRVKQGADALLHISNKTAAPFGLTLVGLRGWGAADAPATLAAQSIAPGATQVCGLKATDSGTCLVRAVPSRANEAQRGAVCALVIDEAAAPAVDSDRVLLLQDWLIGAGGQLLFGSTAQAEATRAAITVNHRLVPEQATLAPGSRIRLRLINGSAQRAMLVACEGITPAVVAVDGQPCPLFTPAHGTLPLGPGARFDLMADMPDTPDGEVRIVLRGTERLGGAVEPTRTLLTIRTEGAAREKRPPIAPLPPNPALPTMIPLEVAKRLDLAFAADAPGPGTWAINGRPAPPAPLLTVRQGDAVALGFVNTSMVLVPIRVQGQAMRVLHAKDDGWDPYWRDSVLLPPGGRSHVAFVADSPGRWSIESGFDDQLLAGLRCWFLVTPR